MDFTSSGREAENRTRVANSSVVLRRPSKVISSYDGIDR